MNYIISSLVVDDKPCAFRVEDVSAVIAESSRHTRIMLGNGDSFVVDEEFKTILEKLKGK